MACRTYGLGPVPCLTMPEGEIHPIRGLRVRTRVTGCIVVGHHVITAEVRRDVVEIPELGDHVEPHRPGSHRLTHREGAVLEQGAPRERRYALRGGKRVARVSV